MMLVLWLQVCVLTQQEEGQKLKCQGRDERYMDLNAYYHLLV